MSTAPHTQQPPVVTDLPWKPISRATQARILAGLERNRRNQAHERFRLSEQMFALLSRGLGVSQILERAAQPFDSPTERLNVAVRLRTVLVCALNCGHAPAGVKNTLRDLTRTLAYLDRRIATLVEEVAPGHA
jgi:hypothetical protein